MWLRYGDSGMRMRVHRFKRLRNGRRWNSQRPRSLSKRFLSMEESNRLLVDKNDYSDIQSAVLFASPKQRPCLTPLHLSGTASLLAPEWRHLSPCLGAALACSPFSGNIMRLGDAMAPYYQDAVPLKIQPAAQLASLLYFQMMKEAPVFLTRTKSMPASYLEPKLIGTLLGLSSSPLVTEDAIRNVLRSEHGIKSNYIHGDQWTGVSLTRWMDLIATAPSEGSAQQPIQQQDPLVVATWLAALWDKSTSKQCCLDFWMAYDKCLPPETSIFAHDDYTQAVMHDMAAREEWVHETFDPQLDLNDENLSSAMDQLLLTDHDSTHDDFDLQQEYARALEMVCAAVALEHFPLHTKPVAPNGYFGYDGGEVKADCAEVVVREILDLLLWDEQTGDFDLTRLPATASKELIQLYNNHSSSSQDEGLGEQWFHVLANLPGCVYLAKSPNDKPYELAPTLANMSSAISCLLYGTNADVETQKSQPSALSDLQWNPPIHVWSDTLIHRSSSTGKVIQHEMATLQLDKAQNAIELRMRCDVQDKSGMAVASHLRIRRPKLVSGDQIETLRNRLGMQESIDACTLQILALSLLGDSALHSEEGTTTDSGDNAKAEILITELLSTPLGCDRRGLRSIEKEEDEKIAKRALEQSKAITTAAIKRICELANTDPELSIPLLSWILLKDPKVSDSLQSAAQQDTNEYYGIYERILSLPEAALSASMLQDSLRESWLPDGEALAMLIQWRLGSCTLWRVAESLDASQMITFARLSFRFQ